MNEEIKIMKEEIERMKGKIEKMNEENKKLNPDATKESPQVPDKEAYMKKIMELPPEDQAFMDGYLYARLTARPA